MKPLFAASLLLNLALGAGLVVVLTREPEVVTQTERVVVKEYVNPNIDLESKLISLEADIVELKEQHAEEVQTLVDELTQADITVAELKQGLLPPLVIPTTPRGYGKAFGDLQRKMVELSKDYPERPEKGTEAYREFMLRLDEVMQNMAPVMIGIEEMMQMPEASPERAEFVSSSLGATLGLDPAQQRQVDAIIADSHAEAVESGLLSSESPWTANLSEEQQANRREQSIWAYEQVGKLLNDEQTHDFVDFYSREDFLYRLEANVHF